MEDNIKWLFFDIGSTLVDESAVYEGVFRQIAADAGLPYDSVYETALGFYRKNMKGDKEVAKMLHVRRPDWNCDLEIPYPDAAECLHSLSDKYRIGILANQQPGSKGRLEKYGLLPYINLLIASAEEGIAKPDPKIFQIALQRAECLPEEAVMIGDRIDNDILPAKEVGMRTIWIRQGFGKYWNFSADDEKADAAVDSLPELTELLVRRENNV